MKVNTDPDGSGKSAADCTIKKMYEMFGAETDSAFMFGQTFERDFTQGLSEVDSYQRKRDGNTSASGLYPQAQATALLTQANSMEVGA